ncbi:MULTISPECIES: formylglycine-generating enzyme family protein [Sorangium]|uniref:formylglycine-generating enzyme family protein n=1 Tax=Sorangium TaxID=39643 RepID=UPI003D9C5D7F
MGSGSWAKIGWIGALGAVALGAGCADLLGADWESYARAGGGGAGGDGRAGGLGAGSSGGGDGGQGGAAGAGGGGDGGQGGAAGAGGGGDGGQGGAAAGTGGEGGNGTSVPPSCATLDVRCGPARTSCCDSKPVDGGAYDRSYEGVSEPANARRAVVSSFRLDTYEITVGRFLEFVEAGKGTQADPPEDNAGDHPALPESGWRSGWNELLAVDSATLLSELIACHPESCVDLGDRCVTWNHEDESADDETLPMNCITWFEAMAFCAWDGGRLPTEAEWNYAAAGGEEQRDYPWGDTFDQDRVVSNCIGDKDEDTGSCALDDFLPVGSRSPDGDGRWGQADLAGSLLEWTLDGFGDRFQTSCEECTSCDDCANLTDTGDRVMRGGSFEDPEGQIRTSYRLPGDPAGRYYGIGARCAREP